jgi:uncharacterized protein DUF1385
VEPSTPAALARFDATDELPRLGGMARPDGVVIVSERHWAFAGVDGSLREGEMPKPPEALQNVPLARGLMRLGASLSPLFRRNGVVRRRERWPLGLALVTPFLFFLLPERASLWLGIALTAGLLVWLFRGRTLYLHGAEHRAIAAAEQRRLAATWTGETKPTRFALRCGTNFAALAAPIMLMADWLWPLPNALWTPVVAVLSLAITMELWRVVQASQRGVLRILLWPGLALQRVTTREPAVEETRVALRAVEAVLQAELAAR